MKIGFARLAVVSGALAFGLHTASAQEGGGAQPQAAEPAAEELPAVDVIQDTPVKKAARAKKKAVAVSPLTSVSAEPSPPVAASASAEPGAAAGSTVAETPLPKVPSAVTTVSDTEIEREGTGSIQQALQQNVPGIIISDAAGNPMRAEISYRGFDASPVSGRSQGIAVYQNGVRINEAFGDTVNWDVIPSNAIASVSVVSNNPSFGLNALGGAMSILMKDGFSYQGAEVDVMGGSFGRRQVGVQAGQSSGNAGVYVAGEWAKEDGFRDFSDSEIRRFYGDVGLKGSVAEFHLSLTAADNHFGATAAAPVELLERSWSNTFTSPQTTDLEVLMPTLSGSVKATDSLTFSGVGYYRRYKNRVVDGNVTEIEECGGFLCLEDDGALEVVEDQNGNPVPAGAVDDPLGSIERLNTDSWSWGGGLEAQEKTPLFGRPNQFIAGVSYDQGRSKYRTSSELGTIGPKYVVDGSGIIVAEPDDLAPRNLLTENTYWGLYFSNALDVTDRLTVTVGGRYNHATIKMEDRTGNFEELNTTNKYSRFNPMAGANYKLLPGISLYGGYSESNRAPTPAELGCAEPENPCLIESFLTDDPPLDQVVGRTSEIGLRGQGFYNGGRYTWGAGLFRTLASDDILPITNDTGRIYFVNAGDTLRQGVELSATYETRKWNIYATYAFVDATLDKCTNPGEEGTCAFLNSGDRLPGIPRHRFKAGFEYWLTSKWKFGADMVAASKSPFFPNEVSDEEDLSAMLAGYTRVDLHTSYDITDNIQIYGLVKNLFNQKYGLYGTYFEADEVSEVDEELGGPGFNDPRTISPSMPFAAYGGVKVKF
ncbi:TonB-dependent receptor [Hyphomicrobium sp. CS1GBMeth3]|uniref:TonB-dependent receptor n=1 Tax=Hyphomicrobium sp. CS1GBMeth3 TaxID=1892845 RepID=UPI0009F958F2|nr:TonB-dependent receptor [Hyphomicrobium sp. CS1GBMeth3]